MAQNPLGLQTQMIPDCQSYVPVRQMPLRSAYLPQLVNRPGKAAEVSLCCLSQKLTSLGGQSNMDLVLAAQESRTAPYTRRTL